MHKQHGLRNHDRNRGIINGIVLNSATKNGLPVPTHRETMIASAATEGRDEAYQRDRGNLTKLQKWAVSAQLQPGSDFSCTKRLQTPL